MRILVAVLLLATFSPLVQAQNPLLPAIEVDCAPLAIDIEVHPGSHYTGFVTCTLHNPTSFQEKVQIETDIQSLATAAPGDLYVAPGAEVDFQVSIRSSQGDQPRTETLTVTATVTEYNSFPPPTKATDEAEVSVSILPYSYPVLNIANNDFTMKSDEELSIELTLSNIGTDDDTFTLEVNYLEELETKGIKAKFSKDSVVINKGGTQTVNLIITTQNPQFDFEDEDGYSLSESITIVMTGQRYAFTASDSVNLEITEEKQVLIPEVLTQSSDDQMKYIIGGSIVGLILIVLLTAKVVSSRKKNNSR